MKKYKLGELIEVTRGTSLSGDYYATSGDYIRLTCGNFDYRNNRFKENSSKDNIYYIGEFKSDFLLNEGDIITPLTEQAIGLLGSTAWIPESGKYIQSQDIGKIICKEKLLDKKFAYYLLSSKEVKKQLSAGAQQTKIRHTSPSKIKDCIVWIPSLYEQKNIGEILFNIDRKIALNKAINHNLAAMAKQLYDYWFVQFDFPNQDGKPYKSSGGKMVWNEKLKKEIPKEWDSSILSEISDITMGQSPEGSSYNEKKEGIIFYQGSADFGAFFPSIRQYTTSPIRFAMKRDVLMSVRAPVGIVNIANNDCCIGRGLVSLRSKDSSTLYIYYLLKQLDFVFQKRNINGTTFGSITKDDLSQLPIIKPCKEIIVNYEKICSSIFNKLISIDIELGSLTKQRDELLPLLMNGQVTIG